MLVCFFLFVLMLVVFTGLLFRQAGTRMIAQKKHKLSKLQSDLAQIPTDDLCRDLKLLVEGNLELKRREIADFYSIKLLAISSLPADNRPSKLDEPMWSTDCWASNPAYRNKRGRAFELAGALMLTSRRLQYASNRLSFDVDLADVRDITQEHHKQLFGHLLYLKVRFMANGLEQEFHLTPCTSTSDLPSQINEQVTLWKERLTEARDKRIASRTIEKMQDKLNQTNLRAPEVH